MAEPAPVKATARELEVVSVARANDTVVAAAPEIPKVATLAEALVKAEKKPVSEVFTLVRVVAV
jgi:hypothetical protein